ncbi:MAG: hypothetical protein WB780_22720 [Candidatus Acidiferrales bacterium]
MSGVTADDQRPLSFIQEENKYTAEDHYSQFSVILPAPLAAGESFTFSTTYGGLYTAGDTSYAIFSLGAPTNWYPNSYSAANYATYDMTFHIPKELVMVATGSKTAERTDGRFGVTEWHTDVPIRQADFNLGEFSKVDTSLAEQGVILENFARVHAPTLTITSNQMKRILGEAQLAITLYTDFFGPVPYKRIAVSEQSSNAHGYSERYQPGYWSTSERFFSDQPPFFGQSYAGLILTPLASYDGASPLHLQSYLHALDPYGIAKQWWGNATGQNSYRDRWMFEGLAEFSASLFLQAFYKDGSYDKFWDEELYLLTERDAKRHRRIDEGPVTLGSRLGVFQGGFRVPTRQVSTKGAYIFNMIRMLMWSNETQDAGFKKLMHDFVQTYTNRPATTEDFKAAVEQHMTPTMNLTGDGKMDWFFNEYLDGTALPHERFTYSFSKTPDGTPILNFKIEQSRVDSSFHMAIPVYVKQADGGVLRVASVPLTGNTAFENQIVLGDMKGKPKSAMINYYHDVLCTQN